MLRRLGQAAAVGAEPVTDASVLPAGGAQFDIRAEILMVAADIAEAAQLTNGALVVNHLQALDHCPSLRAAVCQMGRWKAAGPIAYGSWRIARAEPTPESDQTLVGVGQSQRALAGTALLGTSTGATRQDVVQERVNADVSMGSAIEYRACNHRLNTKARVAQTA